MKKVLINLRLTLSAQILLTIALSGSIQSAQAGDDLSKQLANPLASMISVPFKLDYDENMAQDDKGDAWKLNIQPVIPVTLNDDWNLISRTILPIVNQDNIPTEGAGESGLGDTLQSFFFSPSKVGDSGVIWGVGPVFLLPTATEDMLGGEKWAAGLTGVALKQDGAWSYGFLGNHIESFAGTDSRADVSSTFLNPFMSYVTSTKTTLGLSVDATRDWENDEWTVPVNATVAQLLKVGDQLMQVGGGVRYWADAPKGGPEGFGLRLQLTLLFPK